MKPGNAMSKRSKQEYFQALAERYAGASKTEKTKLLDEVCRLCGYHRKHAIRKLKQAGQPTAPPRRPKRGLTYAVQTISILSAVWEAAGYPWSVRLKALLPVWLPWIKQKYRMPIDIEQQLLRISPRQIDRRLQGHKRKLRKRIYGRTKPGRLLKHQIALRTTHWEVTAPGYVEIDLVAHSGNAASGTYIFSLNITDIYSGWVETRAVMGKGAKAVVAALVALEAALPFPLKGIDSDNGAEFTNDHLVRYCKQHHIEFTRGRPYKKDDNAHIEQKNWTHVRKVMGWDRYDSPRALSLMNVFYGGAWRTMMNWYQPCIKMQTKRRTGARLQRRYDAPQTPLDRVLEAPGGYRRAPLALEKERARCDPFGLSKTIDQQLAQIWDLANPHYRPGAPSR